MSLPDQWLIKGGLSAQSRAAYPRLGGLSCDQSGLQRRVRMRRGLVADDSNPGQIGRKRVIRTSCLVKHIRDRISCRLQPSWSLSLSSSLLATEEDPHGPRLALPLISLSGAAVSAEDRSMRLRH